ncbi:MAG: hypothetical protein MI784_07245, partial [Cytophagales bacterium]|nr:hypothetical protein [Cytophagales bacterium]
MSAYQIQDFFQYIPCITGIEVPKVWYQSWSQSPFIMGPTKFLVTTVRKIIHLHTLLMYLTQNKQLAFIL